MDGSFSVRCYIFEQAMPVVTVELFSEASDAQASTSSLRLTWISIFIPVRLHCLGTKVYCPLLLRRFCPCLHGPMQQHGKLRHWSMTCGKCSILPCSENLCRPRKLVLMDMIWTTWFQTRQIIFKNRDVLWTLDMSCQSRWSSRSLLRWCRCCHYSSLH